ncbi:MAG: hypothetical protein SF066_02475 [Thermoanaerobaculia bacterium]|nr:hypothetical protein [Thermoanaerobaculia bacterium]
MLGTVSACDDQALDTLRHRLASEGRQVLAAFADLNRYPRCLGEPEEPRQRLAPGPSAGGRVHDETGRAVPFGHRVSSERTSRAYSIRDR